MSEPLRPTAPIAPAVLLPDDPAVALALAQRLLTQPRMANHAFGLWGYSGETPSGLELTVQSTGIGAASLTAIVEALARHGARRLIRIGRCHAHDDRAPQRLIADVAVTSDGASRAVSAAPSVRPDPRLTGALSLATGAPSAAVAGIDVRGAAVPEDAVAATLVADLETAVLFALAPRLQVAVAAALVTIDHPGAAALAPERIERLQLDLGEAACRALERDVP